MNDESDNHNPSAGMAPGATRGRARLFHLYNGYRLLLAASLLGLLVVPGGEEFLTGFNPNWFATALGLLLISTFPLARASDKLIEGTDNNIFLLLAADIIIITVLVSASGGLVSGFSVLFIITVAAGGFLLRSPSLATLIAAIAVLSVLADAAWLVTRGEADISLLLPAGILGSLLFVVSLFVQVTNQRLRIAEGQASEAALEVEALQLLNEQIVSNMDTGILRIRADGTINPVNHAAIKLLQLRPRADLKLSDVNVELQNQYNEWRISQRHKREPFRQDTQTPALIASFASLGAAEHGDKLIFVEDYTPVTQFAQSLKLDSLSKLTASIAHEIRNPLSAISHAAQLLGESEDIREADKLLCEILVSNSDRVSDIIDNVTEVSRRKAPKPAALSLDKWMQEFIQEYKALLTDPCSISLIGTEGKVVLFDPSHLKRVLTNLFDNGLRHSIADSKRAELRLECHFDTNVTRIFVDVVDFGDGVPESRLSRLFEPFFTTSRQGSGLGLYLCKELCEINGAELSYQRTASGESAFRLSLKIDEDPS